MKKDFFKYSFLHAFALTVYVAFVALFLNNGEKFFVGVHSFVLPMVMLLLLVISAAICGIAIFLKPVMLYLDGDKKGALYFLGYTVGWVVLIMILLLIGLAARGY